MVPDSLSFLTLINKVQSHLVGGLRHLCFQDNPFIPHKSSTIIKMSGAWGYSELFYDLLSNEQRYSKILHCSLAMVEFKK